MLNIICHFPSKMKANKNQMFDKQLVAVTCDEEETTANLSNFFMFNLQFRIFVK